MTQPLSIEDENWTYLITTRTAGSRLWFNNNKELEERVLGILARYQFIYGVLIYAFILMGNHYHLVARFPNRNRARFMRDFNSAVARVVGRYVKAHGRRSVWARRYAYQILPEQEDVLNWFFYVALNPVSSGLTSSIQEYPCYNSFESAAAGRSETHSWIDWSKYLMRSRYNPSLKPTDFSIEYTLTYSRLPGFESLSTQDYEKELWSTLKERQRTLVNEREARGQGFLGIQGLRHQKPGSMPRSSKTSTRHSFRPIVLSLCAQTRRKILDIYFTILDQFKAASAEFQAGNLSVIFPTGTYPPPRVWVT